MGHTYDIARTPTTGRASGRPKRLPLLAATLCLIVLVGLLGAVGFVAGATRKAAFRTCVDTPIPDRSVHLVSVRWVWWTPSWQCVGITGDGRPDVYYDKHPVYPDKSADE